MYTVLKLTKNFTDIKQWYGVHIFLEKGITALLLQKADLSKAYIKNQDQQSNIIMNLGPKNTTKHKCKLIDSINNIDMLLNNITKLFHEQKENMHLDRKKANLEEENRI